MEESGLVIVIVISNKEPLQTIHYIHLCKFTHPLLSTYSTIQ